MENNIRDMYPEIRKVDGEIIHTDTDAIYVKKSVEDYAENDEKVIQEIFNLIFDNEGEVDPVFRDTPLEWYDEDDEGDDEDDEV